MYLLNVFITLPIITSESHEFGEFPCLKSRDLRTVYRYVWFGDEGLQNNAF